MVVGAGPTGIEFLGELEDFVHSEVRHYLLFIIYSLASRAY